MKKTVTVISPERLFQASLVFGAIIAAAITISIFRCPKYASFKAWWDAEGLPMWLIAGLFAGGLYFGS
jgi:hypothetical protein